MPKGQTMQYEEGTEIGGYRLEKFCGNGAYGTVFVAENLLTQIRFALKIIPMIGESWKRELNALIRYKDCRHPNLQQIHHIGQTSDAIYYVMDLADNQNIDWNAYLPKTLANRLQKEGRIEGDELRSMVNQLLSGIESLHRDGFLHRDIKPDNILWIGGHPVLGDIGLLSSMQSVSVAGTFGFLSDDVVKGKRPPATTDDFYALGKVIYCALTGNSPKDYPDYPSDLPLAENADLISASIAACRSPYVQNAAEFRRVMSVPGEPVSGTLRKTVWLMVGVILILSGIATYLFLGSPGHDSRQELPDKPDSVTTDSRVLTERRNTEEERSPEKTSLTNDNFGELSSALRSKFTKKKEGMVIK